MAPKGSIKPVAENKAVTFLNENNYPGALIGDKAGYLKAAKKCKAGDQACVDQFVGKVIVAETAPVVTKKGKITAQGGPRWVGASYSLDGSPLGAKFSLQVGLDLGGTPTEVPVSSTGHLVDGQRSSIIGRGSVGIGNNGLYRGGGLQYLHWAVDMRAGGMRMDELKEKGKVREGSKTRAMWDIGGELGVNIPIKDGWAMAIYSLLHFGVITGGGKNDFSVQGTYPTMAAIAVGGGVAAVSPYGLSVAAQAEGIITPGSHEGRTYQPIPVVGAKLKWFPIFFGNPTP